MAHLTRARELAQEKWLAHERYVAPANPHILTCRRRAAPGRPSRHHVLSDDRTQSQPNVGSTHNNSKPVGAIDIIICLANAVRAVAASWRARMLALW